MSNFRASRTTKWVSVGGDVGILLANGFVCDTTNFVSYIRWGQWGLSNIIPNTWGKAFDDHKAVQSSTGGESEGAWWEMITGGMLNSGSEEVPEDLMIGDVGVVPRLIQVATMGR
jgi:hypothetical protein